MKRVLKFIGIALVGLIALALIVAFFMSNSFTYEKTIVINAPIDSVWANTNSFAALDKWSPWDDHDPNMKKSRWGDDGTIGAVQSWESAIVGSGSQIITDIQQPTLFETRLDFTLPRKSTGKGYIKLVAHKYTTNVTWGMTGSMPYPANIMILFMNFEKSMGKDWDKGLAELKSLSEN